jgi:hypothetical protein
MRVQKPPRIVRPRPTIRRIGLLNLETVISYFLKLLLLLSIPIELRHGQYAIAAGVLLVLGVSMLPAILSFSLRINLPWEIDFLITLVIFAHSFLGYSLGLYQLVPHFDKLLHFGSTAIISMLSFMIYYTFYFIGRVRVGYGALYFFIIITALGLGALWEILEFSIDRTFSLEMQNGLSDTMLDLVFDCLGGTAAAVLGHIYIRRSKPVHRRRFAVPISQLFGYGRKRKAGRKLAPSGAQGGGAVP